MRDVQTADREAGQRRRAEAIPRDEAHAIEAHQPVVVSEPEKPVAVLRDRPDWSGQPVLAAPGRERVVGEDVAEIDRVQGRDRSGEDSERRKERGAGSFHGFLRGRLSRP